jgi:phosphate/sulfate permease
MEKVHVKKSLVQKREKRRFALIYMLLNKEKNFLMLISVFFLIVGIFFSYPPVAMWIGFALAGYSAIANDSIQTIGTFIASNAHRKWWHLWLYIGLIFVVTVSISWLLFDGDVTYQRLSTKGFEVAPQQFAFLQIAAPIFLLIITRLKMPVSTTFLLLSSFTTSSHAIVDVLEKSLLGYVIAFITAITAWYFLSAVIKRLLKGKAHRAWDIAQWITSGTLWAIWIMQDAANIAVYLPRQLNLYQFLGFASFIFFGLGLIFFLKGDKIQEVVNEKSDVKDVRAATLIDLVYALILIVFQWISTVPMSTTWVFIGLLGGRELAIKIHGSRKDLRKTFIMIRKDVLYALIGLLISVLIAIVVNPAVQREFMIYLRRLFAPLF